MLRAKGDFFMSVDPHRLGLLLGVGEHAKHLSLASSISCKCLPLEL
jgi:hypothetical protein